MAKLKSIVFVAGVMLLILAAAVGYLSIKYLAAILPAESYTAGLRQKYITALVLAGAYVLLYAAAWFILILMKKAKRGSQVW